MKSLILNVYGQPMEHMNIKIVGTKDALKILIEAIRQAIKEGRGQISDDAPFFASDGEGYIVEVEMIHDGWDNPEWLQWRPFYHRIVE